jgi:hypothetical protein
MVFNIITPRSDSILQICPKTSIMKENYVLIQKVISRRGYNEWICW